MIDDADMTSFTSTVTHERLVMFFRRFAVTVLIAAVAVLPNVSQARGYRGLGQLQKRAQAQAKAAAAFQKALIQQEIAAEQARAQAEADRKARLAQAHSTAKSAVDEHRQANRKYVKQKHSAGLTALTPGPSAEVERIKASHAREAVVAPRPHLREWPLPVGR
jgi:hypothetical protein